MKNEASKEQIDAIEKAISYVCHLYGQMGPEEQEQMDCAVNSILIIFEFERNAE